MVKYNKKFFFREKEDSVKTKEKKIKEPKKPKIKEAKPKKVKEKNTSQQIMAYIDKIKEFFKKYMLIIIGIVVIILLILFVKSCSSSKNQKTTKKSNNTKEEKKVKITEPVVSDSISINVNQEIPGINAFVKNYDKIKKDTDKIEYEDRNLSNNKYNEVGEYKVKITIDDKEYNSRIVVMDKEAPVLSVKDIVITEGYKYSVNDFISSCSDNSGKECIIDYEKIDDGKYTQPGEYSIGIIAKDLSGNKADTQTATLIINSAAVNKKSSSSRSSSGSSSNSSSGRTNKTCQYGSRTYTASHVLTYSVVTNNCPLDANYAKTDTYISKPYEMAREDLQRLKNQINSKNIEMEISFDLYVEPVLNTEETGLIGYSAYIVAKNTYNNKVVVSYDINPNGTRKYTVNNIGL